MATKIKQLPIPKLKILRDPLVPGNTRLGGGINAPLAGMGILQDPGVPGQVLGDYTPLDPWVPPSTQVPVTDDGSGSGSGSGGGATTRAFDPNRYLQEIFGDPNYQAALGSYSSALKFGRSSLEDQIRQAVVNSGYDPRGGMGGNLGEWAGVVDDATLQRAGANQFSSKALIQNQLDRGVANMNARLAARGALQSGSQAVGEGRLNQQAQQAGSQSMSSLLDAISGGVRGYGDLTNAQETQLGSVREQVAQRLLQLQGYSGVGTGSDATGGTTSAAGATGAKTGGGMVSWNGKTFTSAAGLANYLQKTAGGYSNYADWARDHPSAAARLS